MNGVLFDFSVFCVLVSISIYNISILCGEVAWYIECLCFGNTLVDIVGSLHRVF